MSPAVLILGAADVTSAFTGKLMAPSPAASNAGCLFVVVLSTGYDMCRRIYLQAYRSI